MPRPYRTAHYRVSSPRTPGPPGIGTFPACPVHRRPPTRYRLPLAPCVNPPPVEVLPVPLQHGPYPVVQVLHHHKQLRQRLVDALLVLEGRQRRVAVHPALRVHRPTGVCISGEQ